MLKYAWNVRTSEETSEETLHYIKLLTIDWSWEIEAITITLASLGYVNAQGSGASKLDHKVDQLGQLLDLEITFSVMLSDLNPPWPNKLNKGFQYFGVKLKRLDIYWILTGSTTDMVIILWS